MHTEESLGSRSCINALGPSTTWHELRTLNYLAADFEESGKKHNHELPPETSFPPAETFASARAWACRAAWASRRRESISSRKPSEGMVDLHVGRVSRRSKKSTSLKGSDGKTHQADPTFFARMLKIHWASWNIHLLCYRQPAPALCAERHGTISSRVKGKKDCRYKQNSRWQSC